MARSRDTEALYKAVSQTLLSAYGDWRSDPVSAVHHAFKKGTARQWSISTWRLYRAALRWYLTELGYAEAADVVHTYKPPHTLPVMRGAKKNKSTYAAPI